VDLLAGFLVLVCKASYSKVTFTWHGSGIRRANRSVFQ